MKISVVVPMYNEEENVKSTISRVVKVLSNHYNNWELLIINDGSTDDTLKLANKAASNNPNIRIFSYQPNHGRGRALRVGFKEATGDFIVTLDSDLTYDEYHIPKLVNALLDDKKNDVVIGSPYKKGGKVHGMHLYNYRHFLSRCGNLFLRLVFTRKITTFTGMLRAYRHQVLESLELESNGKEIHLEILSKALAIGADITEVPAIATLRKKGKSKTGSRATIISHLIFSAFEKPALIFVLAGFTLFTTGFGLGIYAIIIKERLNPTRPLMTLMVLFMLVGIQTLFFGFIARQGVAIQRQIYKVQKENLALKKRVEETTRLNKESRWKNLKQL